MIIIAIATTETIARKATGTTSEARNFRGKIRDGAEPAAA
jgi:hypothetical protein